MTDTTLTLKYRPKKLEEVIGQKITVQAIKNAFISKTMHHAYIFGGAYGTGKTSVARILAAMENCEKGPTLEPCGICDNCSAIFTGKSLDVKEIDAASNRSIDDIRDLAKEIRFSPMSGHMRTIVLDEAHSLTGFAAESALKMIEEPPNHVRFILATTDPYLLKDTIHSRCILLRFTKVSLIEIYNHLKYVAENEKLNIEDEALQICARTANGSVRDSLQYLQTLINYIGTDNQITGQSAKEVLGLIDSVLYFHLVDSIVNINAPKGMQVISAIFKDGKDAKHVIDGLYGHLRILMRCITCKGDLVSLGITEDSGKKYDHQAKSINLRLILDMMTFLNDVCRGMLFNLDPQLLMEKYLIDSIIAKKKNEN